jgi:SAM-dependent methyltransferase
MSENISHLYDLIFSSYVAHRPTVWAQVGAVPMRTLMTFCSSLFNEPDFRICDIGCGAGHDLLTFPKLFRESGYNGLLHQKGCDISPKMVEQCSQQGLDVLLGDFRAPGIKASLGISLNHLVWANMALIHFSLADLPDALAHAVDLAIDQGVIAIGIKVGDDQEVVDPADEKIPIDRPTTFFRPETIIDELKRLQCQWLGFVQVPSFASSYSYGWIFARKGCQ